MSFPGYQEFKFEEELMKDSPPSTPKAETNPPENICANLTGSDDSSTVGSRRSMSIFESFDELHPSDAAGDRCPRVPTVPFLNMESFLGGELTIGCDRLNSEASSQIKESGRAADLGACWRGWSNLIAEGGTPNEVTIGCMVDALVSNREVRMAECLVNQWKHKVRPNTVVYSTLIHGWAKQNDAKRALMIFNQMRDENVACNAVTYNCMIHACVRAGDLQGALDLLKTMKQTCCPSLSPDKFTYSTIIKGYCGRGDVESALLLFEQMVHQEGLTPDLVIYNTLLDGCVKARHNQVCDELLTDMTDRWRINPNSYTLSILIKRFGRQGDLTKAFELVYELPRKYGFRANAHVWTCLISACVTHGELHTAESVLNAMSGKKNCVRTFCSAAFEDASLVNRAVEMASACPPDAKTFETLSQGFLRFNEVRKALDVVTEGAQRFGGKMNPQCVAQVAQTAAQMGLDVSLLAREFGGR